MMKWCNGEVGTSQVAVEIRNLTIGYGDKVVASGLNADLYGGELTCLLGTNGVGKSTLLRTLAERHRERCAIVLTEKPDVQNLTVHDLVGLGRSPYTGFFGALKDVDREVVDEALETVGISALARRNFANLSDGEKQKVIIAQALAQKTDIIFMDEPTAFLDYPSKMETLQLLARIAREQNKAVLLSTHDFELSLRYCHRVWIMNKEGLTVAEPDKVIFNIEKREYEKVE